MKRVNRPLFAATLSALLVLPCTTQARPKVPPKASLYAYSVKDPYGEDTGDCYGINNLGQVVGYNFVTGASGKNSRLLVPPPGVLNVDAKSINDSGVVVGSGLLDEVEFHWRPLVSGPNAEGFFITPGFTNKMEYPEWTRVNNAGQMIGGFNYKSTYFNTAIYSDDGGHTWRELPPAGGFVDNRALDLNNLGQVVGFTEEKEPGLRGAGFVTDANGMNSHVLNVPEGADWVIPYGINDSGQVVANAVREKALGRTTMWPYVTGANAAGASWIKAERPGSPQTRGLPAGIDDQGRTAGLAVVISRYNGSTHETRTGYVTGPDGQAVDVRDLIVNWPSEFDVWHVPDVNQRGQFLMSGYRVGGGGGGACYLVCQHKDCDPY